jgi:hypothetical protein
MLKRKSMLLIATLALSASACSSQLTPRAALTGPKAEIAAKIAPRCPTPTRWTAAEQRLVGRYMIDHSTDPAVGLLAVEWERLHEGAKACRSVR